MRAAAAGATVTGLDISPRLLEQARAKSTNVEWMEGDAQSLPFDDAAFDVVASSFGVIFAPDHDAAAGELARVCRAGGRLGLTTWRPNEGLHTIYARFADQEPSGPTFDDWGLEEGLERLLGDAFELRFEERIWRLEGETPEAVWELMTRAAPPVKATLESLDVPRREEFRAAMVDYWSNFAGEGGVSEPRRYLLVLGGRR